MKPKAEHSLDFRGAITPFMLLKARKVFREMVPGQIMEIVSNDLSLREDLMRILPSGDCTLHFLANDQQGNYRIRIEKNRKEKRSI